MDNNKEQSEKDIIERKLKRKIIELLTIFDAVKESSLSLDLDMDKIIETFTHSVSGLFLISKSALFLQEKDTPVYVVSDEKEFRDKMREIKPQIEKSYHEISEKHFAFKVEELKDEAVKAVLKETGVEVIIPMFSRKELKGIYLAGGRISGEPYSDEDKNFLFVFANQTIIAVENAISFKFLQRHLEELVVFNEITMGINMGVETDTLIDMVLGSLLEMLDSNMGFIIIFKENNERLFFIQQGLDNKKKGIILERNNEGGIVDKILNSPSEKIVIFHPKDVLPQELELFKCEGEEINYWLCRWFKRERITGVVGLAKKEGVFLDNENLNLFLTITNQLLTIVLNARLYELSISDSLTGLFIHRYFEQRIKEEISRARRYSYPVSVVMIDIDNFKEYNDTLGHQIGNAILKRLGAIINFSIRKNEDIPTRWGGDEFAIILPETANEGAYILAERIRKGVEAINISHKGKSVKVTVSLGISSFPAYAIDEEELIAQADNALYRVKKQGGNRVLANISSITNRP